MKNKNQFDKMLFELLRDIKVNKSGNIKYNDLFDKISAIRKQIGTYKGWGVPIK